MSLGTYGVAQHTCVNRASDYRPSSLRPWGGKIGLGPDQTLLAERAKLLKDLFGNPFRPVTADPSWLTSTVVALANGIYTDRAFDRLPILADALQDAGCDDEEVLNHCRSEGLHVRGCWVVDLLTGRK